MEIKDSAAIRLFDLYHGQVNSINNIVMGLINLTSVKNTKELKAKIDFERLVQECIHSCHYLDQSSEVTITREIEQIDYWSEWAIVNTILQNLIENAIKYSRREIEPFVDIKIWVNQDNLLIRVEDNGQGIPEEHLGHIFEMFFRASNKAKGSGLGLYILKCAVERLQGSIHVKSILHEGSVFTVKLPMVGNSD
jgi:signal transduction histidine kinase